MEEIKITPGLVLCLIIVAFSAAFSMSNKPRQSGSFIQNVIEAKPLNVSQTAQASTDERASGKSIHVPILMYHHVGPITDLATADLFVSTADFESQVAYFKNSGYQTVTLQQVYDNLENDMPLVPKPLVFTFDDGYLDAFTNAIPILRKYGYTGTFAIATQLLGRPEYAIWDDVITASKLNMEIISHTENHLDLTNPIYTDADLHREIFDSKKMLEQKLGVSVDFFVYPYGKHDAKAETLVGEAGYKMGLTTAYGQYISIGLLLAEPRVRVHGQYGLEKLKTIFESKPRNVSVQPNP